jgi:hypothetical protein
MLAETLLIISRGLFELTAFSGNVPKPDEGVVVLRFEFEQFEKSGLSLSQHTFLEIVVPFLGKLGDRIVPLGEIRSLLQMVQLEIVLVVVETGHQATP